MRKKLSNIERIEQCVKEGKPINSEQEAALQNKSVLKTLEDELEKIHGLLKCGSEDVLWLFSMMFQTPQHCFLQCMHQSSIEYASPVARQLLRERLSSCALFRRPVVDEERALALATARSSQADVPPPPAVEVAPPVPSGCVLLGFIARASVHRCAQMSLNATLMAGEALSESWDGLGACLRSAETSTTARGNREKKALL